MRNLFFVLLIVIVPLTSHAKNETYLSNIIYAIQGKKKIHMKIVLVVKMQKKLQWRSLISGRLL